MKQSKEMINLRKQINKHFLIRVTYIQEPKNEVRLVGAGRYYTIVDKKLVLKHFKKVLSEGRQNYTFKLRGRRKIEFISK